MRGKWRRLHWLGIILWFVAGCWTTEPSLKPPPHPEEYIVPPEDDSRFSSPIEYPRGTLNNDLLKKPPAGPTNSSGGPARFGASGSGGY
jgi:hypothetical protein